MTTKPYASRRACQENREFSMPGRKHRSLFRCLTGLLLFFVAGLAHAQLVANPDFFGVPYGQALQVETLGVLENDTLDGETDFGGTVELLSDVSNGILMLSSDGSFIYSPGPTFGGTDSFTYRALDGNTPSAPATVTLTACTGGPDVFACWHESSYLAKLAALGYSTFQEGIEGAEWDIARSPVTAPSVTSLGVSWTSNHPDTNDITSGSGAARTGIFGVYDRDHGFATGTIEECDVDNPDPLICLFYDGFSGTRVGGESVLQGAGGYISGSTGANVSIIHGTTQTNFGKLPGSSFQFFGVIDARPAGFTSFEFRELDGKVGQELFIFGDDFTFGTMSGGNISPVADPNGPYTGTVGSPVSFDGTGSFDPDGTIVAYDWDFGDGTVVLGAGATPSHTYAADGGYTVTLTVTDSDGATSTITTTATIVTGGSDFTIGGMVSGLVGTGLELQINAGEILGIGADGVFTFATPLADGSAYAVTVLTQPGAPIQSCGVTDGNGTLNGADITDVVVTCVTPGEEIIFADGFEN